MQKICMIKDVFVEVLSYIKRISICFRGEMKVNNRGKIKRFILKNDSCGI